MLTNNCIPYPGDISNQSKRRNDIEPEIERVKVAFYAKWIEYDLDYKENESDNCDDVERIVFFLSEKRYLDVFAKERIQRYHSHKQHYRPVIHYMV